VLFSHGPNKAFLVPDSCISVDVTDDTIENNYKTLVSIIFRQFGRNFGLFDIAGLT